MRNIDKIVVHCTAGNQNNTAADVVKYHKQTLGWKVAGYHYIVEANGTVVHTLPIEQPSNGVAGHNSHIINVCYVGGVDTSKAGLPPIDNRTPAQKTALRGLLKQLKAKFPHAEIVGHRDFNPGKACPSFDARKEYIDI